MSIVSEVFNIPFSTRGYSASSWGHIPVRMSSTVNVRVNFDRFVSGCAVAD